MKVVAYVANLDEYKSIRNYWIDLYVNGNNLTYLDSFGDEHIPREIKKFIGNKNIIRNIYRMQASESVHRYFCIGFIDFIFKGKKLPDFTNLLSPHEFKRNHKVILNFF